MLKRIVCFLVFMVAVGIAFCCAQTQTPTTQGTRFWVSFMRNGYRNGTSDHLTIIASAKENCQVTVTNPYTGYTDSFSVADQGVQTFEIDTIHCYNAQKGGKAYKGLLVTSTDTISLYIANEAENSYDAANVLPVDALGSKYMIQSNKSIGEQSGHLYENRASFLVIAAEDDTHVKITPTCLTNDNHAPGEPYYVVLNTGECYHVLNKNAGSNTNQEGDFSGTWVETDDDKPIAVFNGNCITSVPGGSSSGFDHVFEQAMPADDWGMRFVVTSTNAPPYFNLQNDRVKITALYDNTNVWRDGNSLCQLNEGESFSFEMNLTTEPCTFLESDGPIAVYLYNHSHLGTGEAYGDPSMVWISPVEQTIYEVTFSTFQAQKVERHYVNVVCYTAYVDELTYDNNNISNSFATVASAPEFSYARIEVSSDRAHTIRCPGGFVAHVYGMGKNEGYAYTVGSSAKTLTKQLYVNDILSTELLDGYHVCQGEAQIQFRASFNYEYDHLSWDFGDGTSYDGSEEEEHTYTAAGDFDVNILVYRAINNVVQPFDSLQVTIHVDPLVEIPVNYSTCAPTYHFHGQDYPVPFLDDVVIHSDEGCDTIYHLDISSSPSVSAPVLYDTLCENDEGIWWFDTLRTEPGTYLVIVQTQEGCDSICLLNLAVEKAPENTDRWVQSCAAFEWHDITYENTGDYSQTFTTSAGCEYDSVLHFTLLPVGHSNIVKDTCDGFFWMGHYYNEIGTHVYDTTIVGSDGCESTVTLNLTLHASPPFDEILGLTQVAVATNFWPGEYIYYLDDSTGLTTGSVIWELSDNENGEWDFRPHGASCTIVTYTMGSKELHASTGANGVCDKEVSIHITCSGYDVSETEWNLLKVYPNPARDEVIVEGEGLKGVALMNLLGQQLKEVSSDGGNMVRISVDNLPPALYLIQVMTRNGNKTQMISVTR